MPVTPHRRRRAVTAIEYGLIAAAIIVAIIGVVSLTGLRLKAVLGDAGAAIETVVAAGPKITGDPAYCAASAINAIGVYDLSGSPWVYPYEACGKNGLNAPAAPLTCNLNWSGSGCTAFGYTDASGKSVVYSALIHLSNNSGGGSSGTLFQNGLVFDAAYAQVLGLTYSQFAAKCSAGSFGGFRADSVNSPVVQYGPGTPSIDSAGSYVCSGAKIVSGSL